MKNITPYNEDLFEFHKDVIAKKRITKASTDPDFKTRVSSYNSTILNAFVSYKDKYNSNTLEDIVAVGYIGVQKDTLHKLYKYKSKILQDLKVKLTTTDMNRIISTCQNCTISEVNSFDHFLPKEEFAEFSVNPKNLFPSCTNCNSYKGAIWREDNKRVFLNLYLDMLPEKQYLFVDVDVSGTEINLTYKISNIDIPSIYKNLTNMHWSNIPISFSLLDYQYQFFAFYSIGPKLYNLIKNHYDKLHLCKRFKENSSEIVSELDIEIMKYKSVLSLDDIKRVVIEECNEYRKVYGFNHWKAILKMALINNSDYMSRF